MSPIIKNKETERKFVTGDEKLSEGSEIVPNIEIYWTEVDRVYGRKIALFSSISHPFLIKQSGVIVSNLLIVFQKLAEHSELLKRVISYSNDKFSVRLLERNS